MIALVGKINRGLEPRHQVEQRQIDLGDEMSERAVELIERRARLQGRHRVDQVGDRFRLHQIDPPVEKRAQRELARLGGTRAARDRRCHNRSQHHGAPVRAQLDDVVAGVGGRTRKVGRDNLIDRVAGGPRGGGRGGRGRGRVVGRCVKRFRGVRCAARRRFDTRRVRRQADPRQRRVPRLEVAGVGDQRARNPVSVGPADPHDANPAAAWRRRNGDDCICGGKHRGPSPAVAHRARRTLLASTGSGMSGVDGSPQDGGRARPLPAPRYRRNEMRTVFENASPTLSVVTPATSATARCTMRRS